MTEVLSSAYLMYQPYLHVCLLWALVEPERRAPRVAKLVFTTLVLGYAGYLLVPARGPLFALPALMSPSPEQPFFAALNLSMVKKGGAVFDVFPSLHTAVTLVLLTHDRVFAPRRFWVMAPVGVVLIASTTLLGFHYAVDVVSGVLLAAIVTAAFARNFAPVEALCPNV